MAFKGLYIASRIKPAENERLRARSHIAVVAVLVGMLALANIASVVLALME